MIILPFTKALLALGCGTIFWGRVVGAKGIAVGEIVFNTSITGYQEALSDPSYDDQLILFTFPHIGNSGFNSKDMESKRYWATGLVTRSVSIFCSGTRVGASLIQEVRQSNLILITGVDTRELTHRLRNSRKGWACVLANPNPLALCKDLARIAPQIINLSSSLRTVSTSKRMVWVHKLDFASLNQLKIVVYDLGSKFNILRNLTKRGCCLVIINAYTDCQFLRNIRADGIVLSNGPGDPRLLPNIISEAKRKLHFGVPVLGICLGHQIISLALGAKTERLRSGHHGTNHPVKDLGSRRIFVTTQNHNFSTVATKSVDKFRVTHISLFDESVQGIEMYKRSVFGIQSHPEASPGPKDNEGLFDDFVTAIRMNIRKGL